MSKIPEFHEFQSNFPDTNGDWHRVVQEAGSPDILKSAYQANIGSYGENKQIEDYIVRYENKDKRGCLVSLLFSPVVLPYRAARWVGEGFTADDPDKRHKRMANQKKFWKSMAWATGLAAVVSFWYAYSGPGHVSVGQEEQGDEELQDLGADSE